MTSTPDDLRRRLSDIEATEETYAGLGPADVPALISLLGDGEEWLAARAVYALSRIDTDEARGAVASAAGNDQLAVRVAAASSAATMPAGVSDNILTRLLRDPEPAVRKMAVRATSDRNSAAVRGRVAEIAARDTNARLRGVAEAHARTITS